MFVLIVLFLLSSLLISIVICKDNKHCVNILFTGYIAAILVILFAMITCSKTIGLLDMRPLQVQLVSYTEDAKFDEDSKRFLEETNLPVGQNSVTI